MYPRTMYDYLNAVESNAILQNCNFFGIGNRTALLELAAVRYYTSPVKVFSLTPYGFEHSPSLSDSLYNVYENKLALPVGYSFDSFIRRDTFDALGPVQKQEALLQGVVLDPGACEELPAQIKETAVHAGAYELDYEITELHDLTLTDDTMTAESEDASIVSPMIPKPANPGSAKYRTFPVSGPWSAMESPLIWVSDAAAEPGFCSAIR